MKEEESKKEIEIIDKFNLFIEKWCGSNFPHLIDNDDNDGEDFRDELRKLFLAGQLSSTKRCLKDKKTAHHHLRRG